MGSTPKPVSWYRWKMSDVYKRQDNGKEFLMLHRNKKPNDVHEGKWIGVGGKLERGETPQECAAREIFEETGLRAKPVLKGIITFPEFTPDLDWYTYVFKVTDFEGELIECNEGTLEWVPYDQVLSKPCLLYTSRCV